MIYRLTRNGSGMLWGMNASEDELEQLLTAWREKQEVRKLADRTIKERAAVVRAYFAFTEEAPLKMTAAGIGRFIARRHLSKNSAATYYAAIHAYCVWLMATKRRRIDPSASVEPPKRDRSEPRPISEDELRMLLRAPMRRRTRMYVLLAAFAGLRVHEIAKIRGDEYNRVKGSLAVRGKGGYRAEIAIHDDLRAELDAMPRTGWWFPGYGERKDRSVTGRAVTYAISNAMKRAGIIGGTPHQLRHFYGTSLVDAHVNIRVVQQLMRHASIASTQIYTGVSLNLQRRGVNSLPIRRWLDDIDDVEAAA